MLSMVEIRREPVTLVTLLTSHVISDAVIMAVRRHGSRPDGESGARGK